jgi:hypothetical protein
MTDPEARFDKRCSGKSNYEHGDLNLADSHCSGDDDDPWSDAEPRLEAVR